MSQPALISKLMLHALPDSEAGELICLRNEQGSEMHISNHGLRMAGLSIAGHSLLVLPDDPVEIERGSLAERGLQGPDASGQLTDLANTLWHIRKAELVDGVPTLIAQYTDHQGERKIRCEITIKLENDNSVDIQLSATADQDGSIDLAYPLWVGPHQCDVEILSRQILELDDNNQPTGEVITLAQPDLQVGHYLFKTQNDDQCLPMAKLYCGDKVLTLRSTCPGLSVTRNEQGQMGLLPQGLPGNQDHAHFPTSWVEANASWHRSWQLIG